MIKKSLLPLLILVLTLLSCTSTALTGSPTSDNSAVGDQEALGYNFIIFDSDGDGTKADIVQLTCLGMSGGYGSFRLEVFTFDKNSYHKVFDSEQYTVNESTYKKLSENISGELMIDTFYLVEADDTDNDGCEELVCRQYAWEECHANHIGDIITTFKMIDNVLEIIEVRFER